MHKVDAQIPRFIGIHAEPGSGLKMILGILPFIFILGWYMWVSYERHQENPADRLVPTVSTVFSTAGELAFRPGEEEKNALGDLSADSDIATFISVNGAYVYSGVTNSLLVLDTIVSLKRLAVGAVVGALLGLLVGLNRGLFRGMEALATPVSIFLGIINPLMVLPMLLIVFGVDEAPKYILIGIGMYFPVEATIYQAATKITNEQLTKAFTLGASQLDVVYRVVLPQLIPVFIEVVRISLGLAWVFVVSSEMISASEGLGYRSFLARRNTGMDVIIVYTLWMAFLGFVFSWGLKRLIAWRHPWYVASRGE